MRALHTAATGMMAQELNVQVISNNIANMRTTGYKKQRAEFQDLLYEKISRVGTQTSDQGTVLPVGIEIGFTVLEWKEIPIFPKVKLVDQRGDVAFNAIDTSSRWHEPTPPGEYAATAWIPGNLLNEGLISVQVAICSFGATTIHHHAGCIDAVSFHVQDPAEGDSARGRFTGQWKGVVRPMLEWTTEER